MTPERRTACVNVLQAVQGDLEKEIMQPADQTLAVASGKAIGHLAAQMHALAAVLLAVLEDGAKE